jgi:hypothetical protein
MEINRILTFRKPRLNPQSMAPGNFTLKKTECCRRFWILFLGVSCRGAAGPGYPLLLTGYRRTGDNRLIPLLSLTLGWALPVSGIRYAGALPRSTVLSTS